MQGLDVGSAEECNRYGKLVIEDTNEIVHTFKISVTHYCLIPKDVYTLLGDHHHWNWVVGRQLPGQKFEKVSVFKMDGWEEAEKLKDLNISPRSRNVLV